MYGQRDGEKRRTYSERGYWTSAAGGENERARLTIWRGSFKNGGRRAHSTWLARG